MEDRNLTFGKYKGSPIKKIILTHIGYIMWCLDNLNWFKLNDDEQDLYDAIAIAVVKYNIDTVFPTEKLIPHIKNKENFEKKETPFRIESSGSIWPDDMESPIVKGVLKYREKRGISIRNAELMAGLCRQFVNSIDDYYDMTDPAELFY